VDQISQYFSLLNSERICGEKLELKLSSSLKSVAALPCKKQVVNYTALQHS